MKKLYSFLIPALVFTFIFSTGLTAQETTVSVKVKKDGKVVKDTTYSFEDAEQAEHALMMMDMMGGENEHSKTMVFVSEDGKTTEIKEMDGDSHVWVSDGDHDHGHGKKVVVVKTGDGETFDILIDEEGKDEDGNIAKTKEVKVIVSSDDDGEWTVTETEMDEEKNVEVIVIKEKVVKKK
jgi:hypothetical protein